MNQKKTKRERDQDEVSEDKAQKVNQYYGAITQKMKEKMNNNNTKKQKRNGKWVDFVNVQLVDEHIAPRSQKYNKLGPLHFVPVEMELDDIEVIDLKIKIKAKLSLTGDVELLVSERGPVFEDMRQFKHVKTVHVRKLSPVEPVQNEPTEPIPAKPAEAAEQNQIQVYTSGATVSKNKPDMSSGSGVSKVDLSVFKKKRRAPPPVDILPTESLAPEKLVNLGRELKPPPSRCSSNVVPMRQWYFDFKTETWEDPTIVTVEVGAVIGTGGFRIARKAKVGQEDNMVIKKFIDRAKAEISLSELTPYRHARLSIQMQKTAWYTAAKFNEKLGKPDLTFTYLSASVGQVMDGDLKDEYVMIEKYQDGQFCKYINNDGTINPVGGVYEHQELAESLCHFSYELSGKDLLLVDLQGFGLVLTDPEIASVSENEMLFCIGNNGKRAFERFFRQHKCNTYCTELGLSPVEASLFVVAE